MQEYIYHFDNYYRGFVEQSPAILTGVVVLMIFLFIGRMAEQLIRWRAQKRKKTTIVTTFTAKLVKWSVGIIGLLVTLHVWGFGGLANSLLAGAGISAIIIGFAFKDIVENFLAGLLLAINRPFKLGDIIEVEKVKGPVRGLDIRATHIRVADGRDIWIPNAMILKSVLTNYTRDGLLRHDFTVGVDTATDLSALRNLVIPFLAKQPDILEKPPPDVVIESIGASDITIRVLFWVDVLKSQSENPEQISERVKSRTIREVKELLLEHGYNLPATIVEHKIYNREEPLPIEVRQAG